MIVSPTAMRQLALVIVLAIVLLLVAKLPAAVFEEAALLLEVAAQLVRERLHQP